MDANQNGNTVKLKLKVGGAEIDYEGNEKFLKENVFLLFERNLATGQIQPLTNPLPTPGPTTNSANNELDLDTNTVALYLGTKTGPELVYAAAVNLKVIQGKNRFTREEIRSEMQSATSYYKQSDARNLTQYLESMVKARKLLRANTGEYSLSADGEQEARKSLADNK